MTKLLCMLSRFGRLSRDDWPDLYLMQQTQIEYNYDRYFHETGYLVLKSIVMVDRTGCDVLVYCMNLKLCIKGNCHGQTV